MAISKVAIRWTPVAKTSAGKVTAAEVLALLKMPVVLKDQSLGTVGNSIVGILGGGIGAAILHALGAYTGAGGLDIGSIIGSVVSGGLGGGILMAVIELIRGQSAKI